MILGYDRSNRLDFPLSHSQGLSCKITLPVSNSLFPATFCNILNILSNSHFHNLPSFYLLGAGM